MSEYIQSEQFYKLIADDPVILLLVFVIGCITLVAALAAFPRWFTVTTEHHHHHYHPAPQAKHPLEDLRAGYYHLDGSGRVQPVPVQPPAPQPPRPRSQGEIMLEDLFNEVYGEKENTAPKPPKQSNRPSMSKSKRFRILRRDGFRCKLCGRGPDDSDDVVLHVDHRMPVAKGGDSTEDNLWTLCADCNGAKSDTIMEELFEDTTDTDDSIGSDGDK